MQNACRVIHRSIRIHRRRESVVPEPLSYLAGKARPHQQHLLAGSYPESRPSRLYFRPELHRFSSFYVAKVRISEDNTKQKRLFVFIVEKKYLRRSQRYEKSRTDRTASPTFLIFYFLFFSTFACFTFSTLIYTFFR